MKVLINQEIFCNCKGCPHNSDPLQGYGKCSKRVISILRNGKCIYAPKIEQNPSKVIINIKDEVLDDEM